MKLKRMWFMAAGTGAALAGLAGTSLFLNTKKLNKATAEVISQLSQTLNTYTSMLRLLADEDVPAEVVAKLFPKLGPAIRVGATPWDLSAASSVETPRLLVVFVNGPVELLVALQKSLMVCNLPVVDFGYMEG
ncbi:MAG TPA: hypothetical protein VM581_00275, partial [Magnetospirillaceae bacterium]|nr:hypothetical protein [Magnetospirillaceae bacterium]